MDESNARGCAYGCLGYYGIYLIFAALVFSLGFLSKGAWGWALYWAVLGLAAGGLLSALEPGGTIWEDTKRVAVLAMLFAVLWAMALLSIRPLVAALGCVAAFFATRRIRRWAADRKWKRGA
jgi:hypothetical protein